MCGIAGIVGVEGAAVRRALAPMLRAQVHRGPDDEGSEYLRAGDWHVGLGQRRLSIIDLSPAGHQPMIDPETGAALTYNGELYNFQGMRRELESAGVRFRGHSDTEVILHGLSRWGPSCIARMCGMFAFAYLDVRGRKLLLARDPLGIKPLYVSRGPRGLVFASEVRAVLASGQVSGDVDKAGLAELLAYGAVQEPSTFYRDIRPVPPGAVLEFDLCGDGIGEGKELYRWRFPAPDPAMNEQRAVDELRTRLDTSVKEHLISDVPVGVFLSSGLDSTIIASLAARHTDRLRTYTVGFAENPDLNEAEYTRKTAAALGVEHTEIQVAGSEAMACVGSWLAAMDQPSMDGLNVFVISKAVRAQGVIVALSGQGGDELFGGYPSFTDVPRARALLGKVAWVPRRVRAGLATMAAVRRPQVFRQKAADMAGSDGSVLALYLHRRRALSDAQLRELGIEAAASGLDGYFLPPGAVDGAEAGADAVATISRLESRLYMGNMLLRDGDANGMAHSLEIRVPFLDRRMIDLAYTVPGSVMLPEGRANKHLIRRAFGDLIRPELAGLKKRGFVLPTRRWMVGPLREMCEEALTHLKSTGLVRAQGVDWVWQSFLASPESPIWSRALTLVVLGSYLSRRAAPA